MAKLVRNVGTRADAGIPGEFPLVEGLNRVGRAPGNEIVLDDATVSTLHCELWLMRERLLLRDLDSTNGTFVGGRAVSEVELQSGDTFSVGKVDLVVAELPGRVAIPAPPPPPPPPPRFTPEGDPCCVNHVTLPARFRCPKCGEQYCEDCVRVLGRRGAAKHAFCPQCSVDCVAVLPSRVAGRTAGPGRGRSWLAKLTQTLKIRR